MPRRLALGIALVVVIIHADTILLAQPPVQASPRTNQQTGEVDATAPSAAGGQAEPVIEFSFANASWDVVLDRFAQLSGLVLQMDVRPEGTFNYVRDPRRYTVSQAIDVLNGALISKGFYLLRDDRILKVISLSEKGIPSELIPHVRPEELADRGDSEFVRVMFPLTKISAEDAEQDLNHLVGPYGKLAALGSINRLMVIDTARHARLIQEALTSVGAESDRQHLKQTFQLRRASASAVRDTIEELYGTARTGSSVVPGKTSEPPPALRFQIAVNDRTNTLVVQAPPALMQELSKLIERLDADKAPVVNDVRIFRLRNAQAAEVAELLMKTLYGASEAQRQFTSPQKPTVVPADRTVSQRAAVLRFSSTGDTNDRQVTVESGIMDEIQITPQVRTNSVVVSAPLSSMELVASLIDEMDRPPTIEAVTKVFFLNNADATNMRLTLRELFDLESESAVAPGGAVAGGGNDELRQAMFERPISVAPGENPPISIRIAVNARTNSLVVSGPESAVTVVEAVIVKLDSSELTSRETRVVRLMNARGTDVAEALTSFYTQKRKIEIQQAAFGNGEQSVIGAYQSLEQEVVAVPLQDVTSGTGLPVNNMILVSASPRYFDEVMDLITELDAIQSQVHIQVVIAQLNLRDNFEFGIEWGLQDDALFDRSLATVSNDTANGAFFDGQGFQFQSAANGALGSLPNSATDASLATRGIEAGQALTNLVVGRASTAADLGGASGLLLSASSDSISAMLRALEGQGYLEVISRPQIMTLDGTAANILVGEQFPFVGSFNSTQTATSSPVDFAEIGIHLRVIPTISPDGRILLRVSPTVSELRELVNVQVVSTGQGLVGQQAPRIDTIQADTVVNVMDGQTVVIGGLIQHRSRTNERKVPWLGDLPAIGPLFRYNQEEDSKRELLIVLTPSVVRGPAEMEQIKQVELDRARWILKHASKEHGDVDQYDPYGTQYVGGAPYAGGTPIDSAGHPEVIFDAPAAVPLDEEIPQGTQWRIESSEPFDPQRDLSAPDQF